MEDKIKGEREIMEDKMKRRKYGFSSDSSPQDKIDATVRSHAWRMSVWRRLCEQAVSGKWKRKHDKNGIGMLIC